MSGIEELAAEHLTIPAGRGARDTVLHVALDPAEHARRRAAGLGAVLSWDVLDLLMELPVGEPVPIGSLAWRWRPVLPRLVSGAARVRQFEVTRLAVRPCRVERAVVSGPPTRRSLERASRFAPFCARVLLVPRPPRSRSFLSEADFWGIGVTLDHGGEHEVLVPERSWRPQRWTVAGWRFVEEQYRRAIGEAQQ